MDGRFLRTAMLIGEDKLAELSNAHVIIFGVGGVGGYTAEALCRAGVGRFTLIDPDRVEKTDINRQIIALTSTLGRFKTEVAKERMLDINPTVEVTERREFVGKENIGAFDLKGAYVIDAIDTVTAKLAIVSAAAAAAAPIISAMGAGNKLRPEMLKIADICDTSVCPLCRVMRHELKKSGIASLKVAYSEEEPCVRRRDAVTESGRPIPASVSFVPSVMGLLIAAETIKDLISI